MLTNLFCLAILMSFFFPQEAFWCLVMICEKYIPGYYGPKLVSYNDATCSLKHLVTAKRTKMLIFLTTSHLETQSVIQSFEVRALSLDDRVKTLRVTFEQYCTTPRGKRAGSIVYSILIIVLNFSQLFSFFNFLWKNRFVIDHC